MIDDFKNELGSLYTNPGLLRDRPPLYHLPNASYEILCIGILLL